MNKTRAYLQESYKELINKTSWPSWSELQKTAVLVAVASVIISLIIFVMDKVIGFVLETFYEFF